MVNAACRRNATPGACRVQNAVSRSPLAADGWVNCFCSVDFSGGVAEAHISRTFVTEQGYVVGPTLPLPLPYQSRSRDAKFLYSSNNKLHYTALMRARACTQVMNGNQVEGECTIKSVAGRHSESLMAQNLASSVCGGPGPPHSLGHGRFAGLRPLIGHGRFAGLRPLIAFFDPSQDVAMGPAWASAPGSCSAGCSSETRGAALLRPPPHPPPQRRVLHAAALGP